MAINYVNFKDIMSMPSSPQSYECITIIKCPETTNNVVYFSVDGIVGIVVGTLKTCYLGVPEDHPWANKTCDFFNSEASPIRVNGHVTYTDIDSALNGNLNQPIAVRLGMLSNSNNYKYWIGWEYDNIINTCEYTSAFEIIKLEIIQASRVTDELIYNCRLAGSI
jgi:hypothetical protein